MSTQVTTHIHGIPPFVMPDAIVFPIKLENTILFGLTEEEFRWCLDPQGSPMAPRLQKPDPQSNGCVLWSFPRYVYKKVRRRVFDKTLDRSLVVDRTIKVSTATKWDPWPLIKIPTPTPAQEWLIEFWNRRLDIVRKQDHDAEMLEGEAEYERLHQEATALAQQSPCYSEWRLALVDHRSDPNDERWILEQWRERLIAIRPPDKNCARLAEIESEEICFWFTRPGRSIVGQDDFGNLSGLKTYSPIRKPKRNDDQWEEGLAIVQKAGQTNDVDDITIRIRLGNLSVAQAAQMKRIGSRTMRDMIRERERILRRHAAESKGPGQDALWKAAVANTYSDETPAGWHILVRFPKTKPRVYPLDLSPDANEAELQETLLRLARVQAYRMYLDKLDKRGLKSLGLKPATLNSDPKVQAIRKFCIDKTIQAFKNGKIRDLTPTSLTFSLG